MLKELLYWLKTRSSGLKKLAEDIRDWTFDEVFGEVAVYLPKEVRKLLTPIFIKNQLSQYNCSFQDWSNAYAIYFGKKVSTRWLVAKAWQQKLCSKGGAADLRAGAKVGQKFGVVFEEDLPSDESLSWEEYVNIDFAKYDKLAEPNKIGSYVKITTVGELLRAIDNGYAVAIGRKWLTSMNQGGGFQAPWIIRRLGLSVGGHATLACGYDLQNNGEATDIEANSYGEEWGDKGYFYCPLRDLQQDIGAYGAYAITEVPYTPKEEAEIKSILIRIINVLLSRNKIKTLIEIALEKKDTDFTDDKKIADTVSCAFALSTVLKEYFAQQNKSFPICTSTVTIDHEIRASGLFEEVVQPITTMKAGWIVMCVTGTNKYPTKLPHGHCGLYVNSNEIMSNNSENGLWEKNYTRDEWRKLFYTYGGYPIKIYRLKSE